MDTITHDSLIDIISYVPYQDLSDICSLSSKVRKACDDERHWKVLHLHNLIFYHITYQISNMTTSVVRIRRSGGKVVQDCDLYIGRACTMGGWNLQESKWHNPFSAKTYGLEKCLEMFENYVRNNSALMNSLDELKGKRLGCWCHPNPCHGDILIKLLNEKIRDENVQS